MIVEFLEITFSRRDTCKLLCDTSLALARSSPTRRYTGTYVCMLGIHMGICLRKHRVPTWDVRGDTLYAFEVALASPMFNFATPLLILQPQYMFT